jgi:hypothetical protein
LEYFRKIALDIELKDAKYEPSERDGFSAFLTGLVTSEAEDDRHMAQGFRVVENLCAYFQRFSVG